MKQIVAILLVKNEDLHIRWVINNIVGFCDHIIVLDNHSTDRTWEIVKQLADSTDKITVSRWDDPKTSQEILRRYYGELYTIVPKAFDLAGCWCYGSQKHKSPRCRVGSVPSIPG